jgi:4-amino-4-deoxy-L-arabinose transferase-like glycosyltransferase
VAGEVAAVPWPGRLWKTPARRRGWLIALLLIYAFALQGVRPIYDPDEGRYTAGAITMLRNGDWMTPHWNAETYNLTKPPLTYWAIAASMRLFGRNETAARVPNSLAFAATILLVFLLARLLAPDRPYVAALVYGTALFPFAAANIVTTDTLLALWETLAVYGFALAWWKPETSRWAMPLMWLGFGLAFLTKGPPGLLPLLAVLLFALFMRRWKGLRLVLAPAGLLLFALVGLGWYLVEVIRIPGLLDYFWSFEIVGRLQGVQNRNPGFSGLIVTYLPAVLFGLLPWAAVWLLPRQRQARSAASHRPIPSAGPFLLVWLLVPLVIFLFAQSRISLYLVPLAVPAALALARGLTLNASSIPTRVLVGLWIACLLALRSAGGLYTHPTKDGRAFAATLRHLVGHAPREVLFVDAPSRWSLVFYLDSEVEEADLTRPAAGEELADRFQLRETLADELAEPAAERIILVPQHKEEAFRRRLNELSVTARWLGRTQRFSVFAQVPS